MWIRPVFIATIATAGPGLTLTLTLTLCQEHTSGKSAACFFCAVWWIIRLASVQDKTFFPVTYVCSTYKSVLTVV